MMTYTMTWRRQASRTSTADREKNSPSGTPATAMMGSAGLTLPPNYFEIYHSWLEEYENSVVGAPQLSEMSDDLPDYTDEINAFMDRKVAEFRDMSVVKRYIEFYKQVRSGGEMDIKNEEIWNRTINIGIGIEKRIKFYL